MANAIHLDLYHPICAHDWCEERTEVSFTWMKCTGRRVGVRYIPRLRLRGWCSHTSRRPHGTITEACLGGVADQGQSTVASRVDVSALRGTFVQTVRSGNEIASSLYRSSFHSCLPHLVGCTISNLVEPNHNCVHRRLVASSRPGQAIHRVRRVATPEQPPRLSHTRRFGQCHANVV